MFILKGLKVLCFDTLLQVFILKVDSVAALAVFSELAWRHAGSGLLGSDWQRGVAVVAGSSVMLGWVGVHFSFP